MSDNRANNLQALEQLLDLCVQAWLGQLDQLQADETIQPQLQLLASGSKQLQLVELPAPAPGQDADAKELQVAVAQPIIKEQPQVVISLDNVQVQHWFDPDENAPTDPGEQLVVIATSSEGDSRGALIEIDRDDGRPQLHRHYRHQELWDQDTVPDQVLKPVASAVRKAMMLAVTGVEWEQVKEIIERGPSR